MIVLSLALGIGANTAIFSVLDAVMIKMLPVSRPERLIELRMNFGDSKQPNPREIVGVVWNGRYGQLRKEAPPTAFVPYQQSLPSSGFMSSEVRTAGDPRSMEAALRHEAESLDKDLPLLNVKTQTEMFEEAVFPESLFARLTTWFGPLGLACVGLYGVMTYAVAPGRLESGWPLGRSGSEF